MNIYNRYQKIIGADKDFIQSSNNVQIKDNEASLLIKSYINSNEPLMIARFGSNELNVILNYFFINNSIIHNFSNVISGKPFFFKIKDGIIKNFNLVAGFFPCDMKNIERYVEMSLTDLSEIDILGSWMEHEKYLFPYFNMNHKRVFLEDLSSFNHSEPWSNALAGKKVLVVHPFTDTIHNQFKKRQFLFKDKSVLPEFDLKIVKAVLSYANNETVYRDWFEALDSMTEKVYATDFDIAIIGCGAYGMPLAARIKRMGKQAIHMGGAVQCLFGIKGKRWESPSYNYQGKYYNDYWVRPSEAEKPKHSDKVEDSTYW